MRRPYPAEPTPFDRKAAMAQVGRVPDPELALRLLARIGGVDQRQVCLRPGADVRDHGWC